MRDLEAELKELIVECLDLEDIEPADIDSAAPLFVDGLGLDSIDALELGLHIQKKYNIKLDGNSEETKKYFASVNALKAFIESRVAS
jgi:acyl carrier protein